MPQNFDTTNGLPWPRVSRIVIELDTDGNGFGEYTERMAVTTTDGAIRYLEDPGTCHNIEIPASDMTNPVPMVNPATGDNIGQSTNAQMFYMCALALIRDHQKARESQS